MKTDEVYLAQMRDAIRKIEGFVAGLDKSAFAKDEMAQSAVILQLMLVGELAKRVSEQTKQEIDLPWKEIAGFRDNAIHEYFSLDLQVVWQTIVEDIPVLKEALG